MVEDPETGGVVASATVVVPQRVVIDRYPDGSLTSVITAGRTLGDSENAAPTADMPPEGTVLSRDVYGPGEYEPVFPGTFPTAAAEVGGYIAPPDQPSGVVDAYDAFVNLTGVRQEQILGGEQRAAALRYLAELPGIDVVGAVTDRLGRTGIMFRASGANYPNYPQFLVVAPGTGKILANETHYIGHDREDLRSPSVTKYFAWE